MSANIWPVALVVGLLWQAFSAIGFYTLANNYGLPNPWIAWVPICQHYLLGQLINDKVQEINYAKWFLVIGTITAGVLGGVFDETSGFFVNSIDAVLDIFSIVFYVYLQTALLYQICKPKSATLCLVLGILFPFMISIRVLVIRNNPRNPVPIKR